MEFASIAMLVLAGVASGLAGSIAGLASLFSYPALLAAGLPPVAANVTNTVAMFATTVGSAAGSRKELHGQGARIGKLLALAVAGGALGATLLLTTGSATFELVVPWLIAFASLVLLARDQLRSLGATSASGQSRLSLPLAGSVVLVAVYGGYFGAAAGVLMLAALSISVAEPLPVTNAVKNVVTGAANLTAAIAYAFLAPVDWLAAGALAAGCVLGSWLGPGIVRRLPEKPLRIGIALGGFGLALYLWSSG
jgi:uncharacterized membrane protein YfcA